MTALPSRLKIALLSAGISGVVLIAFGAVMWVLVCDLRLAAVDREIRTLGSRHPGLLAGRGNYERLASSLEFTFGEDYTNRIILLVQDGGGRAQYRSSHWPSGIALENISPKLARNEPASAAINSIASNPVSGPEVPDAGAGRSGAG